MKKALVFALFCLSTALSAQVSGVVLYEEKVNLHRNLPPEAENMKAMIPEFSTQKTELLFTETETLYQNVEEEEDEISNGGMVMKFKRPVAIFYRNFEQGTKVDFREFFGKRILVVDSVKAAPWKLLGKTLSILDHECMGATWNDTTNERRITAWFTDALPVTAGPAAFYGLPGLILALDINDGEQVMVATKIEMRPIKAGEIEVPKKGEKMTDAEYQKYMDDKMKEYGGKGGKGARMFRG